MPISSSTRLGPYEVVSRVGAGGMGEVWLAKDTRLDRSVAIKVLPPILADNAQFRTRFEREARSISQLNHPHICTLYDVGQEDGLDYLVMEYLEGESLADRIKRGPLPIGEVLRIGTQMASALAAAHRHGIIHRDLKPANVMLTSVGAKLLDFGLAKAAVVQVSTEGATEHRALTQEGTILGTFQYMAPEQLEGIDIDARTDIFALGCLLYEMATGKRAFEGANKTSLIAAIVSSQPPPISAVQPMTPPPLEHVIRKCLAKQPDDRWQSAQDVAGELQWIAEGGSQIAVAAPVVRRRRTRERIGWTAATILFAATVATVSLYVRQLAGERTRQAVHSSIIGENGQPYAYSASSFGPVLSPDGRRFVFVARGGSGTDVLFVRSLTSLQAQPLAGSEGASYPFWSPDSRFIGYFANGKLRKIDANGGPPSTLANAGTGRGGSWSPDNVIVFSPDSAGPLYRISADGGEPRAVTEIARDRSSPTHRWPSFLPDGKRFLYLDATGTSGMKEQVNAIWVGSLDPEEKPVRILGGKTRALYSRGHLLFVRDGFLLAQRFDPKSLELKGDPLTLAEQIRYRADIIGSAYFSASDRGHLLYQGGSAPNINLVWLDPEGKELGRVGQPAMYQRLRISPDDSRIAAEVMDAGTGTSDIWLFDVARDSGRRLTFDPAHDTTPVWSPDGATVLFGSNRGSEGQLIIKSASGSSKEEILLSSKLSKEPADWSPDGRHIAFNQAGGKTDFWAMPLFGDRKPFPLITGEYEEGWGLFAPDGKWIVYLSNETGQYEAFVMRFPPEGSHSRWQITTTGADWVVGWRSDGRELYYIDLTGNLAALPITLGSEVESGASRILFRTSSNTSWASARDGSRFLMGTNPAGMADFPATLVVDWPAALKR
ncbi:MAG TPA: protein kinase [Thermoanaerobaculia bacterium]|nr:protein kinase [Thermoanaerobaculia bacterium]